MSFAASERIPVQSDASKAVPTRVLQRKCACGSHTYAGEECELSMTFATKVFR